MPYNTNAIPPRKEPTGQTQLPLSRVKKIISQDPDVQMCSNNAAFVITLAAEMFIQHLAEEAHTQAKLERKPRRNIQYKDVGPPPRRASPRRRPRAATNGSSAKPKAAAAKAAAVNGQPKAGSNPFTLSLRGEEREKKDESNDPSDQLELEMRQAAQPEDDGDVDMTG
ncbi:hypothetical protein TrVFT333_001177 [Trichoderma virens FT-333]|nr:hypothetical protein TrVFT333_001177 [Trichoderma virens FT-333]